jgi:hypothetical protein
MTSPERKEPTLDQQEFDQKKHPELLEGEMWITNLSPDKIDEIQYDTKRVGITAYDNFGNVVEGLVPVFISRAEYERIEKEENE